MCLNLRCQKNSNNPVQEASEITRTEKIPLTTDIEKPQVPVKSKHKDLFENPDGSLIGTYNEFKDSQVRFLKEESVYNICVRVGYMVEENDFRYPSERQ